MSTGASEPRAPARGHAARRADRAEIHDRRPGFSAVVMARLEHARGWGLADALRAVDVMLVEGTPFELAPPAADAARPLARTDAIGALRRPAPARH